MARFWRSVRRSIQLAGMFVVASSELLLKRPATREQRAEWLHHFAARAMREMAIPLAVTGRFPERGVLISNHLGYLDIVVFAALHRCVFVAKAEIRRWPLLGWMTTMAGTVYVERGQGGSAVRASGDMRAAAEADLPVVFFPEGTTSNGTTLLKFHSGLLAQALTAGTPITPAFIRYYLTEDNGPDVTVEDDVCYWGDDVSLVPHIWKLLGLRGLRIEVNVADAPIIFSADLLHRKAAALEARTAVLAAGATENQQRRTQRSPSQATSPEQPI